MKKYDIIVLSGVAINEANFQVLQVAHNQHHKILHISNEIRLQIFAKILYISNCSNCYQMYV